MGDKPFIVGIGGTTRAGSSTEKALRGVLTVLEREGATTKAFYGPELETLPHYAPERPERTDLAKELVEAVRRCDGLVIASPGYHGSIAGLVKNALDYLEDLRDDERPYLTDRPVGVVATGAGWQGVVATIEHMRSVVHALRGWVTPLGAGINSTQKGLWDGDGNVVDEKTAFQLGTVATEILAFIRARWAEPAPSA